MELLFHFTDPLTNVGKTCRINGQQLFNFAPATNQSTHPATVGVRYAPLAKLFCMLHKCWRLASFMRGTELGGAGIYKTSSVIKKRKTVNSNETGSGNLYTILLLLAPVAQKQKPYIFRIDCEVPVRSRRYASTNGNSRFTKIKCGGSAVP